MNIKLKLLNIGRDVPEGYIYLADSEYAHGFKYMISEDNYELAAPMFTEYGDTAESDEALEMDSSLWLAFFLDKEQFEEVDAYIIDTFGGAQKTVAILEIGSTVAESFFDETVVILEEDEDSKDASDDTDLLSRMIRVAENLEDDFHEEESAYPIKEGKISEDETDFDYFTGFEDNLSKQMSVPEQENISGQEELTEEDFQEALDYLNCVENREVYAKFITSICKFAEDGESLSEEVAGEIYKGLLIIIEESYKVYPKDTIHFFDQVMTEFTKEN